MKGIVVFVSLFTACIVLVNIQSQGKDLILDVPLFNQNDERWCNEQLGHCSGTYIGYPNPARNVWAAGGCAVTSLAMVCNFYQPNYTTPKELNDLLRAKGGYTGGCDLWWANLNNIGVLPPGVKWKGRIELKGEFQRIIREELAAHNPVIACVKYYDSNGERRAHFVVIVGEKQGQFLINDPWNGIRTTLNEGPVWANRKWSIDSLELFAREQLSGQPLTPVSTATVLVMDVSGSMAWQWRGGVKIESAKKAALQFIEQVANEPRPSGVTHMIAVVTFSDDAKVVCSLTDNYVQAKNTVISLGTIAWTNLGAGLDTALQELEKVPNAQRFIILLSDGMTNRGKTRDQILATSVVTARNGGICIHTVGFGDPGDIDEEFLKKIAANSGCGSYNYAGSGFELFGTYAKIRHSMLGSNRIVEFSSGPSPVVLLPGQSASLGAFQLTAPARELHYTLIWSKPGRMNAILVDPANRRVTAGYPGATLYSGNEFMHITVLNPRPGIWRVSAEALTPFTQGVQYYGIASARTGGIVIPYHLPGPICFTVLGMDICVPLPDMPTVLVVAITITAVAIVLYLQLVG